jgi:hypothetical protein
MPHEHEPTIREARAIRGGGEIALERCTCGALRLCTLKKDGGQEITDWELEDDEEMPLIWDGPDNDNDGED